MKSWYVWPCILVRLASYFFAQASEEYDVKNQAPDEAHEPGLMGIGP